MANLRASPPTPWQATVAGLAMIGFFLIYFVFLYILFSRNLIASLNEQVTREDLIFPFQVASAMLAYVIFLVVLPCLAIFFSFWRGWLMHLLAISCIIASLLCVPLTIGAFAVQCTRFGIEDTSVPHTSPDQGITKDQYDCLYFSMVTWTTLGYGDFRPTKPMRIIAAMEAVLGHLWLAFFIAAASFFFNAAWSRKPTGDQR